MSQEKEVELSIAWHSTILLLMHANIKYSYENYH